MTLKLETDRTSYILREPIRITMTLDNNSNLDLDLTHLNQEEAKEERYFLEVTSPDGHIEYRELSFRSFTSYLFKSYDDEIHRGARFNKHFSGKILTPESNIATCFYPAKSAHVKRPYYKPTKAGYDFTFPAPGHYKIRAAYLIPAAYNQLWSNEYGELYSNEIDLKILAPTVEQQSILDRVWQLEKCRSKREELEREMAKADSVLQTNTSNSMILHLYLARAMILLQNLWPRFKAQIDEGVALLEHLREEHPEFEREQVCTLLAKAYYHSGRKQAAGKILEEAIDQDPSLEDHYAFTHTRALVTSDIVLELTTEQNQYVLHEPIKFAIKMRNKSEDAIGLADPYHLTFETDNFLFEVTAPDGRMDFRQVPPKVSVNAITNYSYLGVPLVPGDSIRWNIYPNMTERVDHPNASQVSDSVRMNRYPTMTFSRAGTYQVRAIYRTSLSYSEIWHGTAGELYSNPVEIEIRNPTSIEEAILEAIWIEPFATVAVEDDKPGRFSEKAEMALKRIIAIYPHEPMIRYAYFELARLHMERFSKELHCYQSEKSIPIFEMLMKRYPDFRYEEVRIDLGIALFRADRNQDATGVFNALLDARPDLGSDYDLMWHKIIAETDSTEAVSKWKRSRSTVWSTSPKGTQSTDEEPPPNN